MGSSWGAKAYHVFSPVNTALIFTACLLVANMLTQIHRQDHALSGVHGDNAPDHADARVAGLERELREARAAVEKLKSAAAAAAAVSPTSTAVQVHGTGAAVNETELGWYQRVEDIPAGSIVWVTFVNGDERYREMMINWAYHLRELHVPHVVVAFDDIAAKNCREEQIPVIRHVETLVSGDFRADFLKFRKMGSNKPLIVLKLLQEHKIDTVIISDVDTAWMRNPMEFLLRHPTADVLISTDCLSHWVEAVYDPAHPHVDHYHRCGHMPDSGFGRAFNTGTIIFRNRDATIEVLKQWRQYLTDPDKAYAHSERGQDFAITDQLAFNIILERNITPIRSTTDDWRVIWAHANQLRLMALPSLLFTNGHVFFYQHLPQKHQVQAYVVHCTFQRHHTAGKRGRLREEGLWLVDPPEYFSRGNFMTYENDVEAYIASLERATSAPLADLFKHFHAMSYQLAAMRDAFGIASALNRTLILPRFICHCDQDWYASILTKCRVDSSDLTNPFVCPLDVLINPKDLDSSPLSYRLASFLTDKRTPVQVLRSQEPVVLEANADWVTFMRKHNVGAGGFLVTGAKAADVAGELSTMSSVRVLKFSGLQPGSFGGFGTQGANEAFDRVMNAVFSNEAKWCCSGEQPIDVPWITWWYILPTPLAKGTEPDWKIPSYKSPPHCDKIKNGAAGLLNIDFLKQANHPCNFLGQNIQLPATLRQALPSQAKLVVT